MVEHTSPTKVEASDTRLPADWARRYADRGWSVVPVHTAPGGTCTCSASPCDSPGKHPRIRWEEAMSAAADLGRLEEWWRRWPDANVGVVTGRVSGLVVVDVDPRNGGDESLRALESRWGLLPVTPEVRTGGGGRHLWFSVETEIPTGILAAGLDLKAEGGMVVAPPSLHASGARYVWRPGGGPDDLDLALLPSWVVAMARGELGEPGGARDGRVQRPVRTSEEQQEFAEAWERAGIDVAPGDRYYLCPFHDDHRPSLHIDSEGCRWYCFGCGMGGGIGRLLGKLGEHAEPRPRSKLRFGSGRGTAVTLSGDREVDVVGESRHQDELLELTGGRRRYGGVEVETVAELISEPENPADPNAVAVVIEKRHVGYLRREDVAWLTPLLDDSRDIHGFASCRAIIRGGWDRGRGDVGWFGVTLLLPALPG
ncbi:MAG TPA: bifunctional DNA primase/polymerase [Acidimicrobiia bacterium]